MLFQESTQYIERVFSDTLFFVKMVLIGLIGGMVRYLVLFVRDVKTNMDANGNRRPPSAEDVSTVLIAINGLVGLFAGYMSYLAISFMIQKEQAFFLAMGIGSFGGSTTLVLLMKIFRWKFKIVKSKISSGENDENFI